MGSGYTAVLARNGFNALCLLGTHPDVQGVITDIMMPESSGLNLLRAMREHESWRYLPAIVTTVRDDGETVAEAVRLGCKGYILKPVRPARLIERMVSIFGQDKVILISSPEIVSRYSLNPETYQRIARNFYLQIDQAIARLKCWSTNFPTLDREEFTPIVESATLLGAERLQAVLEAVSSVAGSPKLTPHKRARLMDELQQVRRVLGAQID